MLDFDLRKVPSEPRLPKVLYAVVFFWAFYVVVSVVIFMVQLLDADVDGKGTALLILLWIILSTVVVTIFMRIAVETYVMTTDIDYRLRKIDAHLLSPRTAPGIEYRPPGSHPVSAVTPGAEQRPADREEVAGYSPPTPPSPPGGYPPAYGYPPRVHGQPQPPRITWGGSAQR